MAPLLLAATLAATAMMVGSGPAVADSRPAQQQPSTLSSSHHHTDGRFGSRTDTPTADPTNGGSGQLLPPDPNSGNTPSDTGPSLGRDASSQVAARSGPPLPIWAIIGLAALVVVSLAMTLVAVTTLWWMLHAWRSTTSFEATGFSRRPEPPRRRFSLLVPARHEELVLGHTIDTLALSDHPDFEIIVIIGHDDPGTELVAREAAARHPDLVRVVIDSSVPKNKPRGMNTALPECTGDVVGVFDAEDEVHPGLLRLIDARFTETGADIVQGGVQLMNVHTSWWSLRNCLEYYFWFRSRLHFHAEARFIPLGGNTVFVHTDLLREAGGWDGDCLAEDCELGVRLSTQGARVAVAYDPEVVTREETPSSVRALVKQRTRWSQGFLQVLRKGDWRNLPTRRQRALARYTLTMPFLQAFTGLMIPVSAALIFTAKVPVLVALVTFLPIVPTVVTLVVEMAGLGEFGRAFGTKVRLRDYLRLVLGTFPYQVLLAFAALRAVWRESRGEGGWEKTEHVGAHVTPSIPLQRVPVRTGEEVSR